jgi:nicotinamide-nucleotide amidase
MPDPTSASLIAVGDEILLGQTLDSNSNYIAARLSDAGILVKSIRVVADDEKSIIDALTYSVENFKIIILTGGLGPTQDDLTRSVIAKFFGRKLVFRQDLLEQIEQRYRDRNITLQEGVKVQADFPEGAEPIPNKYGTAPGIFIRNNDTLVFAVPGVPREMKGMVDDFIIPHLVENKRGIPFRYRVIRTAGIGESGIAEILGEWAFPDIHLAYLPKFGCVDLRISAVADNNEKAESRLDVAEVFIESKLEKYIYGYGDIELAQAVGDLLLEKGWKLAVAESCTGGMLGSMMTDIPGSSDYFEGGFITYSNALKAAKLGVPTDLIEQFGAVSKEVAEKMAEGAAKNAYTEVGVGITGIAGPTGGTPEKPVGTVFVAVHTPEETEVIRFRFKDDREMNRQRSVFAALTMLHRILKKS